MENAKRRRTLTKLGLPPSGTRNGTIAAERPLQSYEERAARAFVGGLVLRSVDRTVTLTRRIRIGRH